MFIAALFIIARTWKQPFFTSKELDGSWKKMEFSFTPEKDETVNISLRGNSGGGGAGKKVYPFIHVDALEVSGAVIKNPGFEEFKDGKFKNWSRNKNFQVTKAPKEGKYAVLPFPPAPNPSQHQSLFQRVNSSHEVAKVLGVSALASFLPMNTQD